MRSGDTVQIEPMPGGYYNCAIWRADDLTIEGVGNNVRLTDMTCQGIRVMEGAGARAVKRLAFSGNTLLNNAHALLTFVLNWTGTTARMENNHLPHDVTPVSSSGHLGFLIKSSVHRSLAAAKAMARSIYHHF